MTWKEFHRKKKKEIEIKLKEYVSALEKDGVLKEAMLYSLEAGGKRLRPFLALVTANLLGEDESKVYPYACALEFIHTYSLIHDDLPAMDDDDIRRGKPSSHKMFGEDIAILAGDALLTDAFTLIMQLGEGNVRKGGAYLSEAAGGKGMVYGQVLDCKVPESDRGIDVLNEINHYKTGKLIGASLAGAASYLDADEKTVEILEKYGKYIGLAFQIADDILDIVADEQALGKPVGSDAGLGKSTYPSILGIERAKEIAADYIEKARQALSDLPDNASRSMLYEFSAYIIERSN